MKRGLAQAESIVREILEIDRSDDVTQARLDRIEKQLESIIRSPFRQALMYLRERNVDRAKDKLIEAVSLDELDLPAVAMYCALLEKTNSHLALEYYEDVMRRFGLHPGIVPNQLAIWTTRYLVEGGGPLKNGFVARGYRDRYPTMVVCSPWNVVVRWEHLGFKDPSLWLMGTYKPTICAYDWCGKELLRIDQRRFEIIAITGEYLVLGSDADHATVWSLSRGVKLPRQLLRFQAYQLFAAVPSLETTPLEWPATLQHRYGNAVLHVAQESTLVEKYAVFTSGGPLELQSNGKITVEPNEPRLNAG